MSNDAILKAIVPISRTEIRGPINQYANNKDVSHTEGNPQKSSFEEAFLGPTEDSGSSLSVSLTESEAAQVMDGDAGAASDATNGGVPTGDPIEIAVGGGESGIEQVADLTLNSQKAPNERANADSFERQILNWTPTELIADQHHRVSDARISINESVTVQTGTKRVHSGSQEQGLLLSLPELTDQVTAAKPTQGSEAASANTPLFGAQEVRNPTVHNAESVFQDGVVININSRSENTKDWSSAALRQPGHTSTFAAEESELTQATRHITASFTSGTRGLAEDGTYAAAKRQPADETVLTVSPSAMIKSHASPQAAPGSFAFEATSALHRTVARDIDPSTERLSTKAALEPSNQFQGQTASVPRNADTPFALNAGTENRVQVLGDESVKLTGFDKEPSVPSDVEMKVGIGADPHRTQEVHQTMRNMGAPEARSAEVARQIAVQIAQNVGANGGSVVELQLTPEELGLVKFRMSLSETGVNIAIQTDRPETQDLMRRHMDQLQTQFASLGFGEANISFGDRQSENSDSDGLTSPETGSSPLDEPTVQQQSTSLLASSLGVDIRV